MQRNKTGGASTNTCTCSAYLLVVGLLVNLIFFVFMYMFSKTPIVIKYFITH